MSALTHRSWRQTLQQTVAIVFHLSRRNELGVVSQEIPTRIFSRVLLSCCHYESSVPGCQNTAVHLSRNSAIQTGAHQVSVKLSPCLQIKLAALVPQAWGPPPMSRGAFLPEGKQMLPVCR